MSLCDWDINTVWFVTIGRLRLQSNKKQINGKILKTLFLSLHSNIRIKEGLFSFVKYSAMTFKSLETGEMYYSLKNPAC